MKTHVVIDRFEGDYAVCEQDDRTMLNILKARLPVGAKEGDVLVIKGEILVKDTDETVKRRQQAAKLIQDVFKQNPE